jgi:hypothetical protein
VSINNVGWLESLGSLSVVDLHMFGPWELGLCNIFSKMVSCSQLIMMVLVVMDMCWAVRRGPMSLPGGK